jgi:hypothetical protein
MNAEKLPRNVRFSTRNTVPKVGLKLTDVSNLEPEKQDSGSAPFDDHL